MSRSDKQVQARNQEYLSSLITRFEGILTNDSSAFIQEKAKKGEFRYIPFSLPTFLEQLEVVAKALEIPGRWEGERRKTFIDVGCGVGTKVAIAAEAGFDASGIEITPKYVAVAKRLVANTKMGYVFNSLRYPPTIHLGNALKHDYSNYDVIYFYWPIQHQPTERRLEAKMFREAKRGTLFIANGYQLGKLWEDPKKVESIYTADNSWCRVYRKR